jgi:hypothetical protein
MMMMMIDLEMQQRGALALNFIASPHNSPTSRLKTILFLVWSSLVWSGLVWSGLVWSGLV